MAKPKTHRSSGVLILSIQAIHAERIFNGLKQFELRKAVPQKPFRRAYIYETGGVGIVGCFDTAAVIRLPIQQLWELVGNDATSEERFFDYFRARRIGCAIPITNLVRFPQPILPTILRQVDSTFSIPISSRLIKCGTKLFRLLETTRRRFTKPRIVRLRRIRRSEHAKYIKLVTQEIAPKYDDITKQFAQSILRSQRLGYDPNGILTVRKEVMAIENANHALIGFTTFTHKLGGSVKTGPTVLLPGKRKLGWGSATRAAIAEKARLERIRKLYCTCPDWDVAAATYLLRAGYRIEAHLASQYTRRNGEFVFGLQLENHNLRSAVVNPSRSNIRGVLAELTRFTKAEIVSAFRTLFSHTWTRVSTTTASEMIGGYFRHSKRLAYEEKPISLVAVAGRKRLVGMVLLVPKRGGAVKALLMSGTMHRDTLRRLIKLAEGAVSRGKRRKLYFIHPMADDKVISVLVQYGYIAEGVLRSPYRKGQDAAVYSRFF